MVYTHDLKSCPERDVGSSPTRGTMLARLTMDTFESIFKHMARTLTPTVETTKDFILIRIPRRMFAGDFGRGKLSSLELGLAQSLREAEQGKIEGPFTSAKDFLRALKKPGR